MTSSRKKPGVAFWATVLVSLVMLYPISFGPTCWLCNRHVVSYWIVDAIYRPLAVCSFYGGRRVMDGLCWYGELVLAPRPSQTTHQGFGASARPFSTAENLLSMAEADLSPEKDE